MHWPRALFSTWDAAGPSRRAALAIAASALAVAALLLVIRPLQAAVDRAHADVVRSQAMLDIAKARIADSESLATAAPAVRAGDWRGAVDGVMARYALRAVPVASTTTEGQYAIVVADAAFDPLVDALDALAHDDGVEIVAATIAARVEPGRVRAELTFAR